MSVSRQPNPPPTSNLSEDSNNSSVDGSEMEAGAGVGAGAALPPLQLAIRTKTSIQLRYSPVNEWQNQSFPQDGSGIPTADCNCLYSSSGHRLAVATQDSVQIYDTTPSISSSSSSSTSLSCPSPPLVVRIPLANITAMSFSPRSTYLLLFTRKLSHSSQPNLHVVTTETGEIIKSAISTIEINRETTGWPIQFSENEEIMGHLVNYNINWYKKPNWNEFIERTSNTNNTNKFISSFLLSSSNPPYYATFSPVKPNQSLPALVSIYSFSSHLIPIVSKQHFKAEEIEMKWSPLNTHLLYQISTSIDKTGKSYYGESALHLMSITTLPTSINNLFNNNNNTIDNNNSNNTTNTNTTTPTDIILPLNTPISFKTDGPIQDFAFAPNNREFLVIQGFQPATCTLFSLSAALAIKDYGKGPFNTIRYSPHGRFLCLGGFGNLAGEMHFFDTYKFKLLGKSINRDGAKSFEWSPDSRLFATASLRPWRRVDNSIIIYTYYGDTVFQENYSELYQVEWRHAEKGIFPNRPKSPDLHLRKLNQNINNNISNSNGVSSGISTNNNKNNISSNNPGISGGYVPPHLRGKVSAVNSVSAALAAERGQTGLKKLTPAPTSANNKQQQQKTQKKKDNNQQKNNYDGETNGSSSKSDKAQKSISEEKSVKDSETERIDVSIPVAVAVAEASSSGNSVSGSISASDESVTAEEGEEERGLSLAELEKRLKATSKKLRQIVELKDKRATGLALDSSQQAKVASENQVMKEIERLTKRIEASKL